MIENFVIVDEHVHTFTTDDVAKKVIQAFNNMYDIEFDNPGTGSINDVLANMKKNGIDYTVMANFAPHKMLHQNNLWSLKAAEENEGLISLVSFHPDLEGDMCRLLDEYVDKGARGIKLHPMAQVFEPDDSAMESLYKYCNELRLPIVFHCGRVANARLNGYADIDRILPVLGKHPDIPFILTHMADGNINDVIDTAQKYPNVIFDTSIVISGYIPIINTNEPSWNDDETVIDVVNRIGARRIVFGSDYPWGSPEHDIMRFIDMKLEEDQKSMILGQNSLKIFNIKA